MRLNKKKVVVSALALSLVAILSAGTLAWFSAKDSVTNEFHIADSDDTKPGDIFSVDVWEYVDPDGDGQPEEAEDGATYADILPGTTYVKEPHVENTGHYDQYIRVIVTISDMQAWVDAMGADYKFEDCFVGFDENMWKDIGVNRYAGTDEIQVVLYYDGVLESGKDITLFTDVKIPKTLTQEQAAAFNGGFTIDVKAQAVQTENVGEDAYEAFKTVGMEL